MRRLLTLRGWPRFPQVAVAGAAAFLGGGLMLGGANPEINPGMYLLWGLWWPLVPLSFFAFGRLWCALCPVSLVGDVAARALPRRPSLPAVVVHGGTAALVVSFGAVHVANLWLRFEENLPATVRLLSLLGSAALALTVVFRGRGWCTGLCPLGALGRFLA
ncbi:MAG TPA: 4Fe-4S binding protein, partial [bacterium]